MGEASKRKQDLSRLGEGPGSGHDLLQTRRRLEGRDGTKHFGRIEGTEGSPAREGRGEGCGEDEDRVGVLRAVDIGGSFVDDCVLLITSVGIHRGRG